jgi:histidinol-phosphatase (PHP family)
VRYSSLHVHTVFCDGHDEIETYCRTAWEGGFASLGFSAHAPIGAKTGLATDWHMRDERLPEYLEAVRDAKQRWAGKLPVYLGLEVDYIRDRMGPADRDYRDMGLDYLIGSVHYVCPLDHGEPFAVDGPQEEFDRDVQDRFNGDGEALMETYWDALMEMVRAGGFDILGHMDLVKKNNPQSRWFSETGERYRRKAAEALDPIAQSGVVVEVNTGGINRGKIQDTYPSREILGLLRKRSVPVIITADAHHARDLGGNYDVAQRNLLDAGYTRAKLFEGSGRWEDEGL